MNIHGKEILDMGMYLNSIAPYEAYNEIVSDTYFVDKSLLIYTAHF